MKPNIIFVEDDPDISRLVRHHLEQASFSVRPFNTGAGVIAEAEKGRPALFLLDIMVPGGDGLELCRQIRQTPALNSIPVIFLTAKGGEADRAGGLNTFCTRSSRLSDVKGFGRNPSARSRILTSPMT